ncbi:GlcG protein [Caballeronia mineralivorans PML1(12)]|uniref:GlcG protein n=1 Tax=Caballeronia mineralivorans PML1(12) TaxID=908627 RepID=A0A0J1CVZ3_9BURK|nr:heme-binding protein [Caballeronia mineralivorans]KLU24749.1 GlcG protein [Caballeronia mineralivorans PML1(12)]
MQALSLSLASRIVDLALEKARAIDCKPLTVAVLDTGGHLLVLKREDGSGILRPQIAIAKAWGVLGMGLGGRTLAERATAAPAFFSALGDISGGRMAPVPGGVLLRDGGGNLLGSVGISGDTSDTDETCAVFAIESSGLKADPG